MQQPDDEGKEAEREPHPEPKQDEQRSLNSNAGPTSQTALTQGWRGQIEGLQVFFGQEQPNPGTCEKQHELSEVSTSQPVVCTKCRASFGSGATMFHCECELSVCVLCAQLRRSLPFFRSFQRFWSRVEVATKPWVYIRPSDAHFFFIGGNHNDMDHEIHGKLKLQGSRKMPIFVYDKVLVLLITNATLAGFPPLLKHIECVCFLQLVSTNRSNAGSHTTQAMDDLIHALQTKNLPVIDAPELNCLALALGEGIENRGQVLQAALTVLKNPDDTRSVIVVDLSSSDRMPTLWVTSRSPVPLAIFTSLIRVCRVQYVSLRAFVRFEELSPKERLFVEEHWLSLSTHRLVCQDDLVLANWLSKEEAKLLMRSLQRTSLVFIEATTLKKTLFYDSEMLRSQPGAVLQFEPAVYAGDESRSVFSATPLEKFLVEGSFQRYNAESNLRPVEQFEILIFVSHPWLAPDHPDPDSVIYKLVVKKLQQFVKDCPTGVNLSRYRLGGIAGVDGISERNLFCTSTKSIGVWVDWTCLPQEPRSPAEDLIFEQSVRALNELILAPRTILVTAYENAADYHSRAWCAFEFAVGRTNAHFDPDDELSLTPAKNSANSANSANSDAQATPDQTGLCDQCAAELGKQACDVSGPVARFIENLMHETRVTKPTDKSLVMQLLLQALVRNRSDVFTSPALFLLSAVDDGCEQSTVRVSPDKWEENDGVPTFARVRTLIAQGSFLEARDMAKRLREMVETENNDDIRKLYEVMRLAFSVEFHLGAWKAAAQQGLEKLEFVQTKMRNDPDSPDWRLLFSAKMEYAEVLKRSNRLEESLDLWRQSLLLAEQVQADDRELIAIYNNIAMQYYHLYQHGASVPYFRRLLAVLERVHGPDHPDVHMTRANISVNEQMAAFEAQAAAQDSTWVPITDDNGRVIGMKSVPKNQ
jgi:tetratricopeptide (TPR) repeat protein